MTATLSHRLDRAALFSVSRDRAAYLAHAALNPVSDQKPAEIAASLAIVFAVIAERTGMDAQELYALGRRMLHHHDPHHDKANVQQAEIGLMEKSLTPSDMQLPTYLIKR